MIYSLISSSLDNVNHFPVFGATAPQGGRAPSLSRIHNHTQTHHTQYYSSGRVIGPSQRPLPENTQHPKETDIHAADGIRTHNLSRRVPTDPHLRQRGHWDRLIYCLSYKNKKIIQVSSHFRFLYPISAIHPTARNSITSFLRSFGATPSRGNYYPPWLEHHSFVTKNVPNLALYGMLNRVDLWKNVSLPQ
jgi:hypothetical protein